MSYEMIRHGLDDNVLVVTLNRPGSLNAAPPHMFDEIRSALKTPGARAVLITGEGRAFCSGADVSKSELDKISDPAQASYDALVEHYNPTIKALVELDVPVVTAVRGPAVGIGCSLGLAGDFCVASSTAFFLQAFVNIGLVPDGGASWILPRTIGRARATEMMMLGERVPARQAFEWGLIHKVVDDHMLDAEALALAKRLANGPTRALGTIRKMIHQALESDLDEALSREAIAQRSLRLSDDVTEGLSAFAERRRPIFTGR